MSASVLFYRNPDDGQFYPVYTVALPPEAHTIDHSQLLNLGEDDHPQYLMPSELIAGANVTIDIATTPGSAIIASSGGGGGSEFVTVNVTDAPYSAVGDGTTDDTSAIQAAITAAGIGGRVIFPQTSSYYKISASLKPLERQMWIGQHSPRYSWNEQPSINGALRAAPTFTGSALIHNTATPVAGVTIRNLALVGNGESGTLDGIDFGPASGSERAWRVEACTINGFGGAAICGFGWVVTIRDCHISRNGYGISPHRGADSASRFNDAMIVNNYIYFNYHHAIEFASSVETGLISIIGNRLERSGVGVSGDTYDPNAASRDANACGLYVTKATSLNILGNTTDANTGSAMSLNAGVQGEINNINSRGNIWKRDGIGTNSGTDTIPGVYLSGVVYSTFHDVITYGDPDDGATNTALIVPKRGVEFGTIQSQHVSYAGSVQLYTGTATEDLVLTTVPWQSMISIPRQGVDLAPQSAAPPDPRPGTFYYDVDDNTPRYWDGTTWQTFGGAGVSDHGALTGLGDNDHPQYHLATYNSNVVTWNGTGWRYQGQTVTVRPTTAAYNDGGFITWDTSLDASITTPPALAIVGDKWVPHGSVTP